LLTVITIVQRNPDPLKVYDWLLVLDREVEHVWRRKWSIGKVLYIISRYGTLVAIPLIIVCELDSALKALRRPRIEC
jgi:hypothetical protein